MTVSSENLTPGEMLAAARGKAELSLEQLAENTKIPMNMLRAMEMDEYHKVSGDLYVKSFLRAYAKEVGLEPEEMIEAYHVFTGATVAAQQAAAAGGWDESDVQIKRVGLPWAGIVSGAVVLLLIAGAVYWFLLKNPGEGAADSAAKNEDQVNVQGQVQASSVNSTSAEESLPDTLALGWQTSTPANISGKTSEYAEVSFPEARPGDSQVIFSDERKWPYVIRLISKKPGKFEVKKDAEKQFQDAVFAASVDQIQSLPETGIVPGTAYAIEGGFVVYWGVDDHLSIRLSQVDGVGLTFNAVDQDLDRFTAGQEILLDPSLLNKSPGN